MVINSKLAAPHLTLIVWLALLSFVAFSFRPAAAFTTLKVEASNGLPRFPREDLSRYLASQMTEAGLSDWRFESAAESGSGPDRVEWSFKLKPYAGGEVRRFGRSSIDERSVHTQRLITIEARLYLHGEYQTLVEGQAVIDEGRGPGNPHLGEAVANVTKNLLGPSGAYRTIDVRQRQPP
jgi:hypothetical protein